MSSCFPSQQHAFCAEYSCLCEISLFPSDISQSTQCQGSSVLITQLSIECQAFLYTGFCLQQVTLMQYNAPQGKLDVPDWSFVALLADQSEVFLKQRHRLRS